MIRRKNKLKRLKFFFLSLAISQSLALLTNAWKNNNSFFAKDNFGCVSNIDSLNTHNKTLDIHDLIVKFPWLKKYQNDENFINGDFYDREADLIKKAIIDQYFLQIKLALKQLQNHILYSIGFFSKLKFKYTFVLPYHGGIVTNKIVFNANYFRQWEKAELGPFFDYEKLQFDPNNYDNKWITDLRYFFLDNEIKGIYYINDNEQDDANNSINQKIRKKIREIKKGINFCKEQLLIFIDSVSQNTLKFDEKLVDLIPFLALIVNQNKNKLNYWTMTKNKSEANLGQDIVDSIDRRRFVDWVGNYYNVRTYIPKESRALLASNEYEDFFSYFHDNREKYIHNKTFDFVRAINDFLPIAQNNYKIIALEKAVSFYIFGVFKHKNITSIDWEDWTVRYGESAMTLLATIITCVAIVHTVAIDPNIIRIPINIIMWILNKIGSLINWLEWQTPQIIQWAKHEIFRQGGLKDLIKDRIRYIWNCMRDTWHELGVFLDQSLGTNQNNNNAINNNAINNNASNNKARAYSFILTIITSWIRMYWNERQEKKKMINIIEKNICDIIANIFENKTITFSQTDPSNGNPITIYYPSLPNEIQELLNINENLIYYNVNWQNVVRGIINKLHEKVGIINKNEVARELLDVIDDCGGLDIYNNNNLINAICQEINKITNENFSHSTLKTFINACIEKSHSTKLKDIIHTMVIKLQPEENIAASIEKQLQEIVYSYVNVYDVVRDIHWWLENYIGDFFADELEVEDITSFYTFIENELYHVIFRCIDDNYYVKYGDVIKIVFYMLIDRYGVISNKGMENCPHLDEDHRLEKYKELLDKGITISKLFEIIDTYVKKIGGCEYHKDTHTDT